MSKTVNVNYTQTQYLTQRKHETWEKNSADKAMFILRSTLKQEYYPTQKYADDYNLWRNTTTELTPETRARGIKQSPTSVGTEDWGLLGYDAV
jgi:hypothetical protein